MDFVAIAHEIGPWMGATIAVVVAYLINRPARAQLKEQQEKYEERLKDEEAKYRELYASFTSAIDGKIAQTRKISFQLIAVKQKIDEMRRSCNPQLWILGIDATGPLHQGREIIIDVLKNNGSVRVLLLDPIHKIFDDRSVVEHDSVGRISAELLASLYILLDMLYQVKGTKGAAERLELGFHHEPPEKSLIMVNCEQEDGLVLVNPYPSEQLAKMGGFVPKEGLRGMEGLMHWVVGRGGCTPGYPENVAYYRMLWEGDAQKKVDAARKVKLTIPEKRLTVQDWPSFAQGLVGIPLPNGRA